MPPIHDPAFGHVDREKEKEKEPLLLPPLNEESQPNDIAQSEKERAIAQACDQGNLDDLVQLVSSAGGLLNDKLRCTAWPLLLGCTQEQLSDQTTEELWRDLPRHQDEDQVQLDVNRAFVYYPCNETEKSMTARKAALSRLIVQVLRQHPMLRYFQGYHDIVQVLLLVLGEQQAPRSVARISLLRIRDYMLPSLSPALKHLQLLPAILLTADAELAWRLSKTSPFFALSATLTLYAHDIQEYGDIARLYDFILAHEPVMSIYLFAAIVLSRRSELMEVPLDEPDMLHFTLSKLPQPLDLEALISRSLKLFQDYPPERLPGKIWWRLSSLSVLKTSRSLKAKQTLEEGEELFLRQAIQMRRQEFQEKAMVFLYKNRSPIASVAGALLAAVFAVWLTKGSDGRLAWLRYWRS